MYRKASILLNLCAINKRHTTIKCIFVHMWYVLNVLYIACTPVMYVMCRR